MPPMPFTPAPSGQMAAPSLTTRIMNILTKPNLEWPVIETENTSVAALYTGYIVILAAIPAVAGFIGMAMIGINFGFGTIRIGVGTALTGAILRYLLALGGVYLAALIIDKLAPNFESQPNFHQAFKLVAYASTASWLAGIFNVLPPLSWAAILGLYSIYLFYLGLPVMMKTPQDKVVVYMIVSAVVIIVIYAVPLMIVSYVVRPSISIGNFTF